MIKAIEYLKFLKRVLLDRGETLPQDRAERVKALSYVLRLLKVPHAPAKYDEAGNCLTCGESSEHCPGVHTFEEIQAAGRAAAAIAQPPVAPCNGCLNCINKKEPLP